MHRLRTPHLALLVLFAACSSDAAPGGSGAPDEGAPAARATETPPAEAPATPEASTGGAAAADAAAPAPQEPVPQPVAPTLPKREPTFDFAPGGPVADADLGKYHVALACAVDGQDVGTMTVGLWAEQAPITARNFLRLCDEGFYDGLTFHRIMRSFMVQGGDPTATGMGNGPYGTIQAEFSEEPERAHGYGVLSMARMGNDPDSASCQFFICCDEGPSVWGLDGNYSSFGRITSGVATLEALAEAPVTSDGREASKPTVPVTITRAEVREGPAPTGETIARPAVELDLGGEPERIVIQHVLLSFAGTRTQATRTQEEAEALAADVLAKAQAGEDFAELVRTHSDDPVQEWDETPGVYRLLNNGVRDMASERAMFALEHEFRGQIMELREQLQAGTLSQEDFQKQGTELQMAAMKRADAIQWAPRGAMVPAFGDVGFTLEVGAIGLARYETVKSPFGWHVIKRLE